MAGDIGWVGLDERALLRVEGPDARELLQGLVSNDLGRLAPDHALHAALLTPQGKYLFDFVLIDDGRGAVVLDTERARAAELRQRLLMYRMRAKATVEDAPAELAVVAVVGEGAAGRLGLAYRGGSGAGGRGVRGGHVRRSALGGPRLPGGPAPGRGGGPRD
jgi:folate-binding Fe-S cluster repair protein YgfZ